MSERSSGVGAGGSPPPSSGAGAAVARSDLTQKAAAVGARLLRRDTEPYIPPPEPPADGAGGLPALRRTGAQIGWTDGNGKVQW